MADGQHEREHQDLATSAVAEVPDAPAAKAFQEVAGKVAAQTSIQNMRVLKVIQTA